MVLDLGTRYIHHYWSLQLTELRNIYYIYSHFYICLYWKPWATLKSPIPNQHRKVPCSFLSFHVELQEGWRLLFCLPHTVTHLILITTSRFRENIANQMPLHTKHYSVYFKWFRKKVLCTHNFTVKFVIVSKKIFFKFTLKKNPLWINRLWDTIVCIVFLVIWVR